MDKLPILSKAQMIAENEMMSNVRSPPEILPLMNRWLVEYGEITDEEFNQLHPLTQHAIETKYVIAQRISLLCEERKRLLQILAQRRPASSTTSQATNADETGSTSSGSFTSEYALPNIMASPNPADQLNDDQPSTSRPGYTTPPHWSNGNITYENAYCADPRKHVLGEMNGEANLSGVSNETVATSTETGTASTNSAESDGAASMSNLTPAPLPPMSTQSPPNHH